jgi:transcriptional regulator with XRE-family HTH domain
MANRNVKSHAFWRVKRLRALKELTLETLAKRTGLTKSYLSKVERGISMPSIDTALKLAEAFEVGVGELFGVSPQEHDYAVVRKNQRKSFSRQGQQAGDRYEAIAPALTPGLFEAFVASPPHEDSSGSRRQHRGQEMIFVLKGRIQISFPHSVVKLSVGDCIVFNGQLPHRSLSTGPRRAEMLVIITNDKAQLG